MVGAALVGAAELARSGPGATGPSWLQAWPTLVRVRRGLGLRRPGQAPVVPRRATVATSSSRGTMLGHVPELTWRGGGGGASVVAGTVQPP